MLIHRVTILLLSSHVVIVAAKKRRFKHSMEDAFSTREAELIQKFPLRNFRKVIFVKEFPGIKLKKAETGSRYSFKRLFDKTVTDCRDQLAKRRSALHPKLQDLYVELGDGSNASDYFNATNGMLEDFTTIWRYGGMELAKRNPNLTVDAKVTLYALRLRFKDFELSVNNKKSRGFITGYVQKNTALFQVNFTLRPSCVCHLCFVRLNEFGHARYDFYATGHKSYNRSIMQTVARSITRHFIDKCRHTYEKTMYKLLNGSLARINPCSYFQYNPKEW